MVADMFWALVLFKICSWVASLVWGVTAPYLVGSWITLNTLLGYETPAPRRQRKVRAR